MWVKVKFDLIANILPKIRYDTGNHIELPTQTYFTMYDGAN